MTGKHIQMILILVNYGAVPGLYVRSAIKIVEAGDEIQNQKGI